MSTSASASARRLLALLIVLAATCLAPLRLSAQERGASALAEQIAGLGVSARLLVIGAHPDDEDTRLITWLARGRYVETAYLSLTRGDGGQNLIGNELGEALGVIRTEELLAARRIDHAHQYFTRAYDFGFSKTAAETFQHWPRDTVLGDVVRVIRAFRPHVIVSVFSGTPSDGHGHHQVAGILAREAYDVAGDTVRFPVRTYGPAWTPLKFYRSTNFRDTEKSTYRYNAGEYSPILGRSYAEIAAESRSQHRSQAFGSVQRKGPSFGSVMREATRVNAAQDARTEKGIFDGIDTTFKRIRPAVKPSEQAALDSAIDAIRSVHAKYRVDDPDAIVTDLERATAIAYRLSLSANESSPRGCGDSVHCDAASSLSMLFVRTGAALARATGTAAEVVGDRDIVSLDDSVPMALAVYNRGRRAIALGPSAGLNKTGGFRLIVVAPDSVYRERKLGRRIMAPTYLSTPRWLRTPRQGDLFGSFVAGAADDAPFVGPPTGIDANLMVDGVPIWLLTPTLYVYADPARGEIDRPVAIVPAVSITLDQTIEYAPANRPIDRVVRVMLRPASTRPRTATVTLELPRGLVADSATRTVLLPDYAGRTESTNQPAPQGPPVNPVRVVEFHVRGALPPGRYQISAIAESEGQRFTNGYIPIEYEHIRPQKLYRDAVMQLEAVDVKLPKGLTVAYVQGANDNVAPTLQQLGIPLTMLDASRLARADLSKFSTVVIGPRAYEVSPDLIANNSRLLDWVKAGGTMVVQYGQQEMQSQGIMPYPVTIARTAQRVTDENSPMTVTDPSSPLLSVPNLISDRDFAGWLQDRTLYMPSTHDPRYSTMLTTFDPGEQPNDASILLAKYGKGTYVYTTLAFFRQLPNGVPGAARIFANLLAAGGGQGGAVVP